MGETDTTATDNVADTETADAEVGRVGMLECEVGITQYVSDHGGFSGVLKSRFSDFQVNEIDKAGREMVLNDLTVPQPPKEVIDEGAVHAAKKSLLELLSSDVMDSMERKEPSIIVEVTHMDKSTRTQVHNLLKVAFQGKFISFTDNKTVEGRDTENPGEPQSKKFIRIQLANGKRDSRRWLFPGTNVHFLVYKENKDTNEVASALADTLHIPASSVSYAGTKDKRAKTTQKFCIAKRSPTQIFGAIRRMPMVHVGNFEFSNETLKLGDLQGNRFHIVLRHVKGKRDDIVAALENVKERGFINYFGMQRFGNCPEAPTHMIGFAILKTDYKGACELIMKPRGNEQMHMRLLRQHWWDTRDAASTLNLFRGRQKTIEMRLIEALKCFGDKHYANAISRLPRNVVLMYLHASQSLIFNTIASRRFKEFGLELIPGDLVYCNGNECDPEPIVEDDDLGTELVPGPPKKNKHKVEEEQKPNSPKSSYKSMVKALSAEDIARGEYSIFDMVLPLPGYDVTFPANVVGKWYVDLLAEHGLTMKSFEHRVKSYSLGGNYRKVLVKPKDLEWQLCQYDDHAGPLILSDIERLRPKQEQMLAICDNGRFQALILEFSLPSSSYATMMLRELLKMDTSKANQILLEQRQVAKIEATPPPPPVVVAQADNELDGPVPSGTEELSKIGDGAAEQPGQDSAKAETVKRKAAGDTDGANGVDHDTKKAKVSSDDGTDPKAKVLAKKDLGLDEDTMLV